MKPSVRDIFADFSARFEGVVPWMYLDVRGLVTVAIGNLIDPLTYALYLPFIRKSDSTPASKDEIAAEWERVKEHPTAARQGHLVLRDVTQLRLTKEGIERVVLAKLDQNETHLKGRFPEFDSWPADAQLATLSMAWACGPAFRFALLEAALRAQNFGNAALSCHMNEAGNPGLAPRNAANVALYRNAACVRALGLDGEKLYYPQILTDDRPTEPSPIITKSPYDEDL